MFSFNLNLKKLVNYTVQIVCLAITVFSLVFVAWPQYKEYQASLPLLAEKQAKNEQMSAFVRYLQSLSDFQDKLFANMGLSKQAIPENDDAPFFLDQIIQIGEDTNVSIDSLSFGGLSSGGSSSSAGSNNSFIRFQAEQGENLDSVSATSEVDNFIDQTLPGGSATAVPALPATIPPQEFFASLSITGSYATTRDFLIKLEEARRLVEVTGITIGVDETTNAGPQTTTTTTSVTDDAAIYTLNLVITGFYMKDPDVAMVGPELLAQQKDLELVVSQIEALTYYEPQSNEEIELNIGRLNPFDEEAAAQLEAEVTGAVEDTGISAE